MENRINNVSDIKSGMWVVLRNNQHFLVIENCNVCSYEVPCKCGIGEDNFILIDDEAYDNNLLSTEDREWDIMQVRSATNPHRITTDTYDFRANCEVLYERQGFYVINNMVYDKKTIDELLKSNNVLPLG